MSSNLIGFAVILCLVAISVYGRPQQEPPSTTTEQSTWDKIKKGVEHGWQVVYDESHCALHKAKELIKQHNHTEGDDPCLNKPYQQSTIPTTIVLVAEDRRPVTQQPPSN